MPDLKTSHAALLAAALDFPEAWEDHPWGDTAIKVRKKVFFFLGLTEESLSMSCKLPVTGLEALGLPFTSPTHYGMGKYGWVTSRFAATDDVPVDLLIEWMDESYRAIAPKTLVKKLPALD